MPPPTNCCIHASCMICMYSSLKQLRPSFYSVKRGVISQSHCTTVGEMFAPYSKPGIQTKKSSWWFQPPWKILVKMGIFPKVRGENEKIFETTTPIPILTLRCPPVRLHCSVAVPRCPGHVHGWPHTRRTCWVATVDRNAWDTRADRYGVTWGFPINGLIN